MSRPVILFDIDRTLLDTYGKLTPHMLSYISIECGAEHSLIKSILTAYLDSLPTHVAFRVDELIEWIGKEVDIDPLSVKNVIYDNNDIYKDSLFKDAVDVLEYLYEQGNTLGIYSESSDQKFQNNKFYSLGITRYFESRFIHIVEDKLKDVVFSEMEEDFVIIDDNLRVIKGLEAFDNVTPVFVDRKNEGYTPVEGYKINELTELPRVLERIIND